jgi:hypothetical protein
LHWKRNNLLMRSETGNDAMEVDMTRLAFATGGPRHQTRFVIVNDRLPRTDEHCALCGGRIEKGYIRDSRTRLIYCDTQCFAGVMAIKSKLAVITASAALGSPAFAEFLQTDITLPTRRR